MLEFLKHSDDKVKKKFKYKRDTEKALENALKVYESLESDSLLPFQYLKEVMLG